uniref:Uncharacterized protein n=1 Tax=Macrostomum lignano TaxID=282301 RepID=A0A1I8IQI3_9PLAT
MYRQPIPSTVPA